MLTKLEVRNSQGALLVLPLENVDTGIIVLPIDGLGPVKATIASSKSAQQAGAKKQSTRRDQRNIMLKLQLDPDYSVNTVWDLRNTIYSFFMTESEVSLRFFMNGLTVDTTGTVETCEPSIFVQEPQIDISILCDNPDFLAILPVEITGVSTSTTTETLITYDGSVNTGLEFVLNVNRTLTEFTFYHKAPNGIIRSMDFAASLVAGDVLTINTVSGTKGATRVRAGTLSSVLYGISPQSTWHELVRGDNYIRIYAVGAAIPYSLKYTKRYGGL